MKKTTIGMLLLVCSVAVQAQFVSAPSVAKQTSKLIAKAKVNEGRMKQFTNTRSSSSSMAQSSFWLSYPDAYNTYYGTGTLSRSGNYLYSDSLPIAQFSGNVYDHPWVHSIADAFHPSGEIFLNNSNLSGMGYALDASTAYSVDSMYIEYIYDRTDVNTSLVDTMIVQVLTNSPPTNMPQSGFIGQMTSYGTDTVFFKNIKYDYTKNMPNASNLTTIKVPLTIADTAIMFYGYMPVAINKNVLAGGIVGTSVTFKAGKTYALLDTLRNSFNFSTFELEGTNTFRQYYACSELAANMPCDNNCSYIIPTDVRYNQASAGGWKGFYIPHYAYGQSYSFESHSFLYKVTYGSVGIKETADSKLKVYQNTPNPSNAATTVNYDLKENASVSLTVYDMTGKQVASIAEGTQSAGAHAILVNTESIQPGVYFYTLTAGENRVTRKMTVLK